MSLVANASDPKQVRNARRVQRNREIESKEDLQIVLATRSGRNVLWRILEECGAFKSAYSQNTNDAFVNIGKQDTGHWLMAEINDADQKALFLMMQESSDLARNDAAVAQALRETEGQEDAA